MIVKRSKYDRFVIRPMKYRPGDLGGLAEIVQRFPETCEDAGGFDVMSLTRRPYTYVVSSGSRPAGLQVRFSIAFGMPPRVKPFHCFSVAYDVTRRYHIVDCIGKRSHLSFVVEIENHLGFPIVRLVLPCDVEPMHVSYAASYICNSIFRLSANPSTEVQGNGKIMYDMLETLQTILDGYTKSASGNPYRLRWNMQGDLTAMDIYYNSLTDLGSVIKHKNVDLYHQDPRGGCFLPGFMMFYPGAL